jgi:hypothetical protein
MSSADHASRSKGGQSTAENVTKDDDVSFQSLKKLIVNIQMSLEEHKKSMKKKLDEQKADLFKKLEAQSQLIKSEVCNTMYSKFGRSSEKAATQRSKKS